MCLNILQQPSVMNKNLISIFATVFLLAFGMSFVTPLVPLLLKHIGASSASIGQIQTTYFLSFTIATAMLGRFIDRAGSKRLIIIGLVVFGSAILAMPAVGRQEYFYLIRAVQGIGSALLFAPTEAAINILSPPEKRASNMGLYGVVFAVGFAIGPAIGASLYAVSVPAPFIVGGVSSFIAAVVLVVSFDETPVPVKKVQWGFGHLLALISIPIAAAACYSVVEVSIASFLPLYLDELAISGPSLGVVFTVFAIGGAVSPYPAGAIADKWGKLQVLIICGIMLFLLTCAFILFKGYYVICFLTFGVGLIAGALYPVALAFIGERVPPERMGSANACFSFFYGLGCVVGPITTGWVVELTSIHYMFYPMSCITFLFIVMSLTGIAKK